MLKQGDNRPAEEIFENEDIIIILHSNHLEYL